jgi:phosphoglycolate phosphatase
MGHRRLAIFDFDGTVADSAAWSFSMFNEIARQYGFREISDEEREMLRGRSSREVIAYLGVPFWKLPLIARGVRRMATRDIGKISLFPWVPDLFGILNERGVAIAIVSSNSEANIRRVLGADIAAVVQHYGADASLFGKAAKIKAVIRRCVMPIESATSIGDEVRDVEAAHTVGIPSLAVTWGYAKASALEAASPTKLIHEPAELLSWFER